MRKAFFDSNTGKATSALYELKNFIDASTGISSITAKNKSKTDKNWHTLDGKKIETPNQDGIYIQNHIIHSKLHLRYRRISCVDLLHIA